MLFFTFEIVVINKVCSLQSGADSSIVCGPDLRRNSIPFCRHFNFVKYFQQAPHNESTVNLADQIGLFVIQLLNNLA